VSHRFCQRGQALRVRGRHVDEALNLLAFTPHRAAVNVRKCLSAAIADAEFASAPYTALRSLKPQLDPSVLRKSFADPKFASRQTQFS